MNFDLHKLDKLKGAKGAAAPKPPSKFAPRLLGKQARGARAPPPPPACEGLAGCLL